MAAEQQMQTGGDCRTLALEHLILPSAYRHADLCLHILKWRALLLRSAAVRRGRDVRQMGTRLTSDDG